MIWKKGMKHGCRKVMAVDGDRVTLKCRCGDISTTNIRNLQIGLSLSCVSCARKNKPKVSARARALWARLGRPPGWNLIAFAAWLGDRTGKVTRIDPKQPHGPDNSQVTEHGQKWEDAIRLLAKAREQTIAAIRAWAKKRTPQAIYAAASQILERQHRCRSKKS